MDDINRTDEETLMRELLRSAVMIYAGMGIDYPLSHVFKNDEIPILPASARIRVVIIPEHDEPHHPLPVGEVFAGVTGYEVEGVAV